MAASVSFRFPSEPAFQLLPGARRVAEVRAAILAARPAAADALRGLSGWKLLLTDEASKTGACCAAAPRASLAAES